MALLSQINLAFSRIDRLTLFYYIAHIFGLVSAITIIGITIAKSGVESTDRPIGEFELNITHKIQVMFYVSAGFLLLTVGIGYLAQRWPDKSSLWILYCILLSIVAVVMLAASISSYTNANAPDIGKEKMKSSMEDQDNTYNKQPNTRWDKLQRTLQCCGTDNYTDWQDVRFGRTSLRVPKSCCKPKQEEEKGDLCGLVLPVVSSMTTGQIYERGCYTPALDDIKKMLKLLSGFGFFIAATHAILTLLSCYLVVSKKV